MLGCCPPYLHADLRQVDLHGQLLAAVHVRVVGLLEGALQLVQLVRGEGGAVPPVLLLGLLLLGGGWWGALAVPWLPQLTQVPLALIQEHGGTCRGTAELEGCGVFGARMCPQSRDGRTSKRRDGKIGWPSEQVMQRHNPLCHCRGSQGWGVLGADLQSWGLTQHPKDASRLALLSDAIRPMNPLVLKVRFPLKWRIL